MRVFLTNKIVLAAEEEAPQLMQLSKLSCFYCGSKTIQKLLDKYCIKLIFTINIASYKTTSI